MHPLVFLGARSKMGCMCRVQSRVQSLMRHHQRDRIQATGISPSLAQFLEIRLLECEEIGSRAETFYLHVQEAPMSIEDGLHVEAKCFLLSAKEFHRTKFDGININCARFVDPNRDPINGANTVIDVDGRLGLEALHNLFLLVVGFWELNFHL